MVPLQDTYMQSRAEALQNVESTIQELSNIFTVGDNGVTTRRDCNQD
ncbi:hypothetical protein BVRB_6g135410 [Beta vulgaris subsp. vulgaris]|nr:hypothetical protein BVRB_6g135410 [Beta vulgaris subsp. vulgaris]